jgi:competence protein ComEC
VTFKSEIVFVRILFPFIAGIICAYLFANEGFIVPSLIITSVLLSYLLVINLFYKRIKAYNFKGITGLVFYLFSFALGGLICLLHTQSYKKDYFAKHNYEYLKVWVNAEPQLTNNILRFEVEVTNVYQNHKPKEASVKS